MYDYYGTRLSIKMAKFRHDYIHFYYDNYTVMLWVYVFTSSSLDDITVVGASRGIEFYILIRMALRLSFSHYFPTTMCL